MTASRQRSAALIRRHIDTARGRLAADLVITNARPVNVFTAELLPATEVAVKGEWIVAVGDLAAGTVGPDTKVIDAGSACLLPGFIETHTHIANVFRLHDFTRLALPRGTTTVITEVTELGNVFGLAGVRHFLAEARRQPLQVLVTAPCFSPPYPELETIHPFSLAEYEELFADELVVGVGEAYWPRIIDPDDETLELLSRAARAGLALQGHSAGARGAKLNAFIAAGISSCHEPTTADEALERLRRGLYLMIREGSIRRDLAGVAPIREVIKDCRRVAITTDGVTPSWLLERGHLDGIAREAVRLGFDPLTVVQMLTINAAEAFGLRHLGAVAPGCRADLQLVERLEDFVPQMVIAGGRPVAAAGRLTVPVENYHYPESCRRSLPLPPFSDSDFHFPANGKRVRVRAVRIAADSMLTTEEIVTLPVAAGNIQADPEASVLKYVIFNRYGESRHRGCGFLSGTGIRRGAVASTLTWEAYQPMVFGASEAEMALAANRLRELQGGIVVVAGRRVLAELPLVIGGVCADLPLAEVARREKSLIRAWTELGSILENPFYQLQALSFTGLPHIRLTDKGLFDIRRLTPLSLVVS